MAIQTSFAKKMTWSQDCNHRFLALLGNDGEFDLALLDVKRRRERADVQRLRRHVEEMREQAPDLAIKDADELPALGHHDAEQLLGCQTERVFLVHRRDVIEPVEIG